MPVGRLDARGRDCRGDPRSLIQGRPGTERLLAKLRAVSESMGRPWPGYVAAILKKQGIERLEWAYPEDLRRVVASMEYQKKREDLRHEEARWRGSIDGFMA